MYEEQLKELGLTDNEVRIYLVLLKNGVLSPYQIAEKTGLHRGHIYDTLERMQEKGIVSSVLIKNKKHFQATDPYSLIEIQRLRLESLERIAPELKNISLMEKAETKVELHKGDKVYRTLIKDLIATLKKGETVLLFGIDEEIMNSVEPMYIKQYFNIIKRRGIKENIIIKKGGKRFKSPYLKYKELEEKHIGNSSYVVYGNKLAMFVWGIPNYLIIIENKNISETYRKQFGLLWGVAK